MDIIESKVLVISMVSVKICIKSVKINKKGNSVKLDIFVLLNLVLLRLMFW